MMLEYPIQFSSIRVPANEVDLVAESSFIHYVVPDDRTHELRETLQTSRAAIEAILNSPIGANDMIKALEAISRSTHILRRYMGLQKVVATAELVEEELTKGKYEKVVILCQHRDVIEGIRVRLKEFKAVTLYSGTALSKRARNIEKFQNNKRCKVLVGAIQAINFDINLTVANHVLVLEPEYEAAYNVQAIFRCHKVGQSKPVYVRFVSLEDKLDYKVTYWLRLKTNELYKSLSAPDIMKT